jgi:hypothetical protein
MADICMAVNTHFFGGNAMLIPSDYVTHQSCMAIDAILLEVVQIHGGDAEWFGKGLECELPRMAQAVLGLGCIFCNERVRRVAIVTRGTTMMA